MTRMRTVVTIWAAAGIPAGPGAAQIDGRVTDRLGRPVTHALVELWSGSRRVAAIRTVADGGFTFPTGRHGHRVVARRIGFRPATASVDSSFVTIQLSPFAVHLQAIDERVDRWCGAPDDPVARRRWDEAAAPYRPTLLDQREWGAYDARAVFAVVTASQLGVIDTLRLGPAGVAAGGGYLTSLDRRVERDGYVWARDGLHSPRSGPLEYPRLESVGAPHFASPVFGRLHRFAQTDHPAEIRFCPAREDRPGLRGVLEVAGDGSITRVSWAFVSTNPSHRIGGGEVIFAPDLRRLQPLTGLFWQRRLGGRYYQEWWEYRGWRPRPGPAGSRSVNRPVAQGFRARDPGSPRAPRVRGR